jgi:HrpA-like RNA helicase
MQDRYIGGTQAKVTEILRSALSSVVLTLKKLGIDVSACRRRRHVAGESAR